jgi:hypothetical protein
MIPLLLLVCTAITIPEQSQPPAAVPIMSEPVAEDTSPAASESDLPVSVERVQRALSRQPAIKLKGDQTVFRVEVLGKKWTIEEILGPDYLKGPVPRSGMTHQEFLDMVTPKDYQGYAAFSNGEGAVVAVTSLLQKWALQKAVHKFETAKEGREREAARKEVEMALADLERARLKAGLSPR